MPHFLLRKSSFKRLFSFSKQDNSIPPFEDNNSKVTVSVTEPTQQKPTWKCFTYEEILEATDGFSSGLFFIPSFIFLSSLKLKVGVLADNLVGKGGYAEVYRGVMKDGQVLAVKRLNRAASDERKEREFLTEIGTIGHVHHPNVSSLLGCCIDNGFYLIFEFSLNGSVASVLHDEDSPAMSWKIRYKIAVGTAQGLNYLHKGCQRRIIHRDIKASNILLAADFEPRISDFGLAKWLPTQWSHHSIHPIEGTLGYLAPEYFMHGIVDEKTDVFAYGVFLLELITGRKPVDGSHQSLVSWAKPILKEDELNKIVDPRLGRDYDVAQMSQLAYIASLCIRSSAHLRPTMSEVLEVMVDGKTIKENWKMVEEPEEDEAFWGFEDLECECDSTFSTSPLNSISTSSPKTT